MRAAEARGDGELVVIAADVAARHVETDLVPALAGRFRVGTVPPIAEPGEIEELVEDLGADRWAGVGVGDGGGTLLQAGLDARPPDALVLLGPRGLDAAMAHEGLSAWEAPVLILGGEEDPAVPVETLERLHDRMPSSSLGLVPGCGDLLTDAWDTVGPMVLEYLRARYLRAPHGHGDTAGLVALQLERRPPWVDLAEYEVDDPEPVSLDPADQEVGPGA